MMFAKLKTRGAKKKFLGAILIMAFVAVFSLIATRYIVISDIDMTTITVVSLVLICALLAVIGIRKKSARPKKRKR